MLCVLLFAGCSYLLAFLCFLILAFSLDRQVQQNACMKCSSLHNPKDSSVGELTLSFISMLWHLPGRDATFLLPYSSSLATGGRAGPGVIREVELSLLFTSCNTQACPLPGQQSKALHGDRGTGELDLSIGELALPLVCYLVTWARER